MGRISLLQRFLLSVIDSGTKCLAGTADITIAMRLTTVVRWALLPGAFACESSNNDHASPAGYGPDSNVATRDSLGGVDTHRGR